MSKGQIADVVGFLSPQFSQNIASSLLIVPQMHIHVAGAASLLTAAGSGVYFLLPQFTQNAASFLFSMPQSHIHVAGAAKSL
jgi:uncharacterized protein YjeT (DUF2065 family)